MRGVILSRDRARKASKRSGGGALRNGFEIRLDVFRELAYDLDMRRIVDHASVRMMEYFSRALLAGRTADGQGALPRTSDNTSKKFGGGHVYGLRSGWMAKHWWRGKIRGGSFRCFVLVKPNGDAGGPTPEHAAPGGRAFVVKNALRRDPPVDFQSIRGGALTVFRAACDEAIAEGFGTVTNSPTIRTSEGLLPQLRVGG
jgi:hypothetical protein